MSRLLIDADLLLWSAASVADEVVDWGDGLLSTYGDLQKATQTIDLAIKEVVRTSGAASPVLILTDREGEERGQNWRTTVMPGYKSDRTAARPTTFWKLRKYLLDVYGAIEWVSLEGDDVLGILQTDPTYDSFGIWSTDKDMLTIPGTLFRGQTRVEVTVEEADLNHMVQALSGDRTDGYPGCPGIGKKRAHDLLTPLAPSAWWGAVVGCYEKAGQTEEDALMNARVARILRYGEYDMRTGVKLWSPS